MHRLLILIATLLALVGCNNTASTHPKLTPDAAKYEAQKLLAALKGEAGSAAFMDLALKNDETYRRIFSNGLRPLVDAAPTIDPGFSRYAGCVAAGNALLRFAELRKIAGRQSEESDKYRSVYWDGLASCEKAVNQ